MNGKQKYMRNVYRSRYIYSVPEASRQNMVIYRSQNPGFFGAKHRTTGFTVCQVKTKQMRKYTVDERILHHLAYIKPCRYWDIDHMDWCRISAFNSITTKKHVKTSNVCLHQNNLGSLHSLQKHGQTWVQQKPRVKTP